MIWKMKRENKYNEIDSNKNSSGSGSGSGGSGGSNSNNDYNNSSNEIVQSNSYQM